MDYREEQMPQRALKSNRPEGLRSLLSPVSAMFIVAVGALSILAIWLGYHAAAPQSATSLSERADKLAAMMGHVFATSLYAEDGETLDHLRMVFADNPEVARLRVSDEDGHVHVEINRAAGTETTYRQTPLRYMGEVVGTLELEVAPSPAARFRWIFIASNLLHILGTLALAVLTGWTARTLKQGVAPAAAPPIQMNEPLLVVHTETPGNGAAEASTSPTHLNLTPRQVEIAQRVAQGQTYKEIATTLHLTESTIKYHMTQIIQVLGVEDRRAAIAYVRQNGLPQLSLQTQKTEIPSS